MNTNNLSSQLYTAQDSREIDARVINSGKVEGFELMKRAGQFAFDCMRQCFSQAKQLAIVCGRGNNGGDGYVVAALAAKNDYKLTVYALAEPATADAAKARQMAEEQGCEILDCSLKPDFSEALTSADLIIDAMLGTGVDREVSGYLGQIIEWVNDADLPVLACDMPTGLHSDTGRVLGRCINATVTVTFITLKVGLFTGEGKARAGRVLFNDLAVGPEAYLGNKPCAKLLDKSASQRLIRSRSESAHKGTTGYAGIIGGSPGMMGAVLMAGKTAYRTGCGRVKVMTHPDHAGQLGLYCPELLTLACDDQTRILDSMSDFSALAIGPGLGQEHWGRTLFHQALESELPLVVDADGLNFLAGDNSRRENWVLTPHPGEAARLLNCTTGAIQADRIAAAVEIVSQYGGVCLLKGSGSLIAAQGRTVRVCADGNSGQATAGMGDVLTGCVVSLIAQGHGLFDAACLATWLHACAADAVADDSGKVGMMATDLLPHIQRLHNKL